MTAIILTKGKSKRIGEDKAFIKIGEDYLIELVIKKLQAVFTNILIVSPNPSLYNFLGVRVVKDIIFGKGPLGAIYTGLHFIEDEHSFICGCDMPFLNSNLLVAMRKMIKDWDILVPVIGGFLEPLHSIYSKNCLLAIKKHLDRDDLKVKSFFPEVRCRCLSEKVVRRYDPQLLTFFNLNTPKMLHRLKGLTKSQSYFLKDKANTILSP